jgi:branched-chain amino acid transport system substrate-binding protein
MLLKSIANTVSAMVVLGCAIPVAAQIPGNVIKIGLITDMTGVYADIDGPGGVEAVKMAIADFGGNLDGKKIELVVADHQNKSDIAVGKARDWFDHQGVSMLLGGTNSTASLAMAKIAAEKKKPFIAIGAGTARLTNEECSPYTVHYAYDTVALAKGTGSAIVKLGGKSWFFITADYAFGTSLEKDTADVVKANGGEILGSARHPLAATSFSVQLILAQVSRAQILAFANAGGDTINAVRAASQMGLQRNMRFASMLMFINDIHVLGLNTTQEMYLTDGWYWDLNNETRAWSKRYFEKMKKQPSMLQAADYSATMHYLNAVKAAGTTDADRVMAQMKKTKINDFFTKNGVIRDDGRMVHDMYLMEVKSPAQSKYPWDYYKVMKTIPGDQAFTTKAESKCALWK